MTHYDSIVHELGCAFEDCEEYLEMVQSGLESHMMAYRLAAKLVNVKAEMQFYKRFYERHIEHTTKN